MSLLAVSNLSKVYRQGDRRVQVLDSVTFNLQEAQSLAILGRSGSGKSTLLSLISSSEPYDSGDIFFAGRNIADFSEAEREDFFSRDLSMIYQQFYLLDHLTALENISWVLELRNRELSSSASQAQAMHLLEKVGLGERAAHRPHQLSRGECQRVAIARVLGLRPRLLLADEPTASLDDEMAKEVGDLLLEMTSEAKISLLMVTHDLTLADRCQRRMRLKNGQLIDVA